MRRWISVAAIVSITMFGVCLLIYIKMMESIPSASPHPTLLPEFDESSSVGTDLPGSDSMPTPYFPTLTPVPTQIPMETSEQIKELSIPVLNYHSIGDEPGNTLVLHPDKFARHLEYLNTHNYTPLSLSDFILILEKKAAAPAKPVLLTFDDGYTDNYDLAMPLLKKYSFPATLFMSPGVVGHPDYLNWEQVKELSKAGWDIQPHGMTHPHLPLLAKQEQKAEITEARKLIEEQLGTTADVFCYPYGEFNQHTLAILKDAGFRYAFTINQGKTTSSQKPLQLKRIYVNGEDSLEAWSRKLR